VTEPRDCGEKPSEEGQNSRFDRSSREASAQWQDNSKVQKAAVILLHMQPVGQFLKKGCTVGNGMIVWQVGARVLPPPEVQYGAQKSGGYGRQSSGGNNIVRPHNGGWDLRNVQFLTPATLESYGIACMAPFNRNLDHDLSVSPPPIPIHPPAHVHYHSPTSGGGGGHTHTLSFQTVSELYS
jgi:hypothetical protein